MSLLLDLLAYFNMEMDEMRYREDFELVFRTQVYFDAEQEHAMAMMKDAVQFNPGNAATFSAELLNICQQRYRATQKLLSRHNGLPVSKNGIHDLLVDYLFNTLDIDRDRLLATSNLHRRMVTETQGSKSLDGELGE